MKTYSSQPGKEEVLISTCALCSSSRSRPLIRGDGFRFVKCRECGLVYQNPQPMFRDLRKRYRDNYFQYEITNEANFFNLMKLGLEDVSFRNLTQDFPDGSAFLDIGCATGMLLEHMRGQGWKVKGVEICRESAEYAIRERNLDIYIGTLEEAAFPDSSFSVAHASHLIEHVPDPRGFLAEIRRILTPGGYAVITTPNIDGFQARLFRERWRSAIADHLTLFSKHTLRRLLEETGFSVHRVVTWGGLAIGSAPVRIKKPVDRLAKRFGFGDVMLYLASPQP